MALRVLLTGFLSLVIIACGGGGGGGDSSASVNEVTDSPTLTPTPTIVAATPVPSPEVSPFPEPSQAPVVSGPTRTPEQEAERQTYIDGIVGSWKRTCSQDPFDDQGNFVYIESTHTYRADSTGTATHFIYADNACTLQLAQAQVEVDLVFGEVVYAVNSIPVLQMDAICKDRSATSVCVDDYNITYFDGAYIYSGIYTAEKDGSSPDKRPDTIDLNISFEKQ